jgi:hypothetical protein
MSDSYIDVFEVDEYGRYFLEQAIALIGASTLVNVEAVRERVRARMEAVAREILASGLQRSGLRTSHNDTGDAYEKMLDAVRRFHRYLQSLPPGTPIDVAAFFPGGYIGTRRKAADLLAQGKQVLIGFEAPANASFPAATEWKTTFTVACVELEQAVVVKGSAKRVTANTMSTLQDARLQFVAVYNGLAKRLVRAVLQDVGRENEFRSFFLDLQVNEDGSPASAEPEAPEAPEEPETPSSPAV